MEASGVDSIYPYILIRLYRILIFYSLIFVTPGCSKEAKNDFALPNILLINVDDLGYMDTELYGNHDFDTPNILKLAAEGMTFTHAYASAANCAPSRACMLSGQYSPRQGIYTVGSSERGKSKDRKLIDQMQKWLDNTHAPIPSIRNPDFEPLELDEAIKKD